MRLCLFEMVVCDFHCFRQADDSVNILGSCTHVAFLPTAENHRSNFQIMTDVNEPRSFWPVKFMSGPGNKMNMGILQVKWKVRYRLHRVTVINCIVLPANLPDSIHVTHGSDFIVCMHERDKASFAD